MALSTGIRLGPYEILAPIGAGGMGEVYRARDTKLKRDVALKLLPDAFAADPERMARFTREAQVLASLNHPNIATIYGVEDRALIMELVEGENLRGPVPVETALDYAKQIAGALEAAHEKGIVHRDLKPANLMITPAGIIKVLDFGLAKAAEEISNPENSPTLTISPTRAGMIIGTAAYMSPEQARGKSVDKRSDIWAFGCVLYELLTGKQAFAGETVSDILAAVLKNDPDWSALPPDTPTSIRRLLRRCLERDRRRRLRDIGDALIEIEEAATGSTEEPQPTDPAKAWRSKAIWALATLVLLLAGITTWAWFRTATAAPQPVMRWTTTLPLAISIPCVTLSPDGSRLVFLGSTSGWTQIFMRPMDQLEAHPITGTDVVNFASEFFSPDGRWIAYQSQGKLKKVAATGGTSITLADAPPAYGGTWGSDDTIVIGGWAGQPLLRIPAAGGKLEPLTKLDPKKNEVQHDWPYFLPRAKAVLFSVRTTGGTWDNARIDVLNLHTGEQRTLIDGGSSPRYARTGHLVYVRAGSLFAVRFDPEKLQLKGSPIPVLEGLASNTGTGFADYSFSDSGDLVYFARNIDSESHRSMVWVDRKGNAEALPAPSRAYSNPTLSPDGQRIAVSIGDPGGDWDIWVYDVVRHTLTRLTFKSFNFAPVWTPDGRRVTFRCRNEQDNGLCWAPSDNSGPLERLLESGVPATPGSWLPDGSALLYIRGLPQATESWVLPLERDRKPRPLNQQQATMLQISPDGGWFAYTSSESGTPQVYVQPFPGPGGKWQISTEGGLAPRWARNGRELFYRNGDKMMAVDIETKPTFRAGEPRVLFEGHYETSPAGLQPGSGYDVSSDGKHFLMIKADTTQTAPGEVQVVHNWFEELRRRVPAGK